MLNAHYKRGRPQLRPRSSFRGTDEIWEGEKTVQKMLRMRLKDWLYTSRQIIFDSFCHLGRTLLEGSTRARIFFEPKQSALPLGKSLIILEARDTALVIPSLGLALYLSRDQIGSLSSLRPYFATCLLELCSRVVIVLPTTASESGFSLM